MAKTHPERFGLELGKFAWRIKSRHRQVVARRAQVLADSQNVASRAGQIAKNFEQFVRFFTEANHHAGLRYAAGPQLLRVAQQFQGPFVTRAGANNTIKSRHRFSVVIEDLRSGLDDSADGFFVTLKVWDQNFNAAARSLPANLRDHKCKCARASQIVVVRDSRW